MTPYSLSNKPLGATILGLGILFTAGFAPLFFWPLSLVALAGLFWLIRHAQTRQQAALATFIFGCGHFLTSLYWIPRSFYIDAGGKLLPALLAGIPALLAITLALSTLLALVAFLAKNKHAFVTTALFIVLFLGLEILKNMPPFVFPWNPLGAIFANNLHLMQFASLGSVYLLSFWGLLIAAALSFPKTGWVFAGLLLALQSGFGVYRLAHKPNVDTLTHIRIVQANIETAHKWDETKREAFLLRYVDHTMTATPEVKHIFWPETAVAYAVPQDPGLRAMIARHLRPDQTLTLGFLHFEEPEKGHFLAYNSAATLHPDGSLGPIYNKHILVPFGETLPFPAFTQRFLRTLSFNRGLYTPGTGLAQLNIGENIQALPLICYEAAFPFYVATHLQNQKVLVNITNDNWFDHTSAPFQHFALARLRAVETGLSLIRVANTGVSAVIDGYGQVIEKLPYWEESYQDLPVPAPYPPTIWIKISNLFNGL